MDPYICPETLERVNRYYFLKKENLNYLNKFNRMKIAIPSAHPVKIILQTTEACNLSCVFCQSPKERKGLHMDKQSKIRWSGRMKQFEINRRISK